MVSGAPGLGLLPLQQAEAIRENLVKAINSRACVRQAQDEIIANGGINILLQLCTSYQAVAFEAAQLLCYRNRLAVNKLVKNGALKLIEQALDRQTELPPATSISALFLLSSLVAFNSDCHPTVMATSLPRRLMEMCRRSNTPQPSSQPRPASPPLLPSLVTNTAEPIHLADQNKDNHTSVAVAAVEATLSSLLHRSAQRGEEGSAQPMRRSASASRLTQYCPPLPGQLPCHSDSASQQPRSAAALHSAQPSPSWPQLPSPGIPTPSSSVQGAQQGAQRTSSYLDGFAAGPSDQPLVQGAADGSLAGAAAVAAAASSRAGDSMHGLGSGSGPGVAGGLGGESMLGRGGSRQSGGWSSSGLTAADLVAMTQGLSEQTPRMSLCQEALTIPMAGEERPAALLPHPTPRGSLSSEHCSAAGLPAGTSLGCGAGQASTKDTPHAGSGAACGAACLPRAVNGGVGLGTKGEGAGGAGLEGEDGSRSSTGPRRSLRVSRPAGWEEEGAAGTGSGMGMQDLLNRSIAICATSALRNLCHNEANHEALLEAGAVQVLADVMHNPQQGPAPRVNAAMAVAVLVGREENNSFIGLNDDLTKVMLEVLRHAVRNELCLGFYWTVWKLTHALANLAVNETNKEYLCQHKAVEVLAPCLMGKHHNMLLVTKWTLTTLWHLAFLDEAKAQILARPGLVAHIQALVHSGQEDAGTLDIARGCLWTLGLQPPVSPKRLSSGASGLQSPRLRALLGHLTRSPPPAALDASKQELAQTSPSLEPDSGQGTTGLSAAQHAGVEGQQALKGVGQGQGGVGQGVLLCEQEAALQGVTLSGSAGPLWVTKGGQSTGSTCADLHQAALRLQQGLDAAQQDQSRQQLQGGERGLQLRPVQELALPTLSLAPSCSASLPSPPPSPPVPVAAAAAAAARYACPAAPAAGSHVMISYEWGSQAKALALKLELEQRRYATWLDLDKMLGNTLAAMAEAVENAAVVVVCVSKKYKESQACRTEAEYAFQLKKRIIPVMMELGYRPNGWLGALLGTKLYYDMCDRRAIPDKVTQLERELVDIAHLVQAGNGSCSLGGGPGHFARPVLSAQQARRSSLSAHRSLAPAPAATASLLPGARMQAVNDRRRSLCRTPSAVVPVLATTPRMSSPGQGLPQGAPTPAPVQKLGEHATPVHSLLPQGRAVLRHSIDINDSSHAQGYVRTALPSSGWALGAGSRSLGFATSSAGMRRKSLSMTALLPNTTSLAAAQLHDSDGSPSPGSASRSEFHAWSQEVLGPLHGDGDALVRISEERTSGLGSPGRSNSLSSARHSYAWVPDLSLAWQAAKQRASMQAQAAAMGAANAGGATPPAGLPEASAGPSSSSRSGASCVPAIAQVLSQLPGSQQGIGGSVTQLEGVSNGDAAPAQRSTEEVGPQGSTACSGPPWDSSSCSSQQHCTVAATLPMRPALPVDISSSLLFSSGATPRPAVTAPSATHKHQQQLQLQPTQEGFGSRLGSSEGRDAASASSTPVGSTPRVPSPATSWLGSTRNIKEQQPRVYSHPAKFGSHAPLTQQNSRLHLNSSLRSFCLSPMELDSSTSSSSPSSSESEEVRQDTLSALQPTRRSNVAQQGNGANGHNHGSSNAARARRHRSQEQSEPVAFAADENVASQLSKSLDKSLLMGSRRSTGRAHALRRSISSTGVMFNQPPVEAQASRTSSGLVRNASGAQARSRGPGGSIDVRISTSAQRTSTSSAVGRGRTSTGREALEREEEEEGLHAHAEEVEIPWSEIAVEHWTNEDVCNWLQDVELPEMQEIVVQHALDGRALCGLHRMSKLNCLRACVIEDLGVKSPRVLLIFIDELLRLFE